MSKRKTLTAKVYGTRKIFRTHKKRIWHTRKDGIRQRYIHKITTEKTQYVEKYFHAKSVSTLKRQIDRWVKKQEWVEYQGDLCYDEQTRTWIPCNELEQKEKLT